MCVSILTNCVHAPAAVAAKLAAAADLHCSCQVDAAHICHPDEVQQYLQGSSLIEASQSVTITTATECDAAYGNATGYLDLDEEHIAQAIVPT